MSADNDLNTLLDCPSCKYTKEQHDENMRRWGGVSRWDAYKPVVYRDRLLGAWVVECKNCGMSILFGQTTEGESIDRWNALPRATSGRGEG